MGTSPSVASGAGRAPAALEAPATADCPFCDASQTGELINVRTDTAGLQVRWYLCSCCARVSVVERRAGSSTAPTTSVSNDWRESGAV